MQHSAEIKPAQCCIKLVFHLTYWQQLNVYYQLLSQHVRGIMMPETC